MEHFDLAVVGAGTAGAAMAWRGARVGMRVVCLERGPLASAGARWVNGVPGWAFDAAGLARPEGAELRGEGGAFHLVAGWGPGRLVLREHGVLDVDMPLLVARLQGLAREAGAELRGDVRVDGLEAAGLATSAGPLRAAVVVDASGLHGAQLLGQPRVAPRFLCVAAQELRRVVDLPAARAFLARHAVPPGETLCFTGVAGGYSILNLRVEDDLVSLLTGSLPALGHPSGVALLRRFVAEQPWIGERLQGGSRAIPVRRPLDRLADGPVALLGDAGCQVFSAHGSGIGVGLVAARLLADTLAGGGTPWDYAVAWQRRWGGLIASYELFRQLSEQLSPDDLRQLMAAGLLDPELTAAGLTQRPVRVPPRKLPGLAAGLLRAPALGRRFAPTLARMGVARLLYARYPRDPGALPAWSRTVARVFGERPDAVRGADRHPR